MTEKETGREHILCQNVPNKNFNATGDLIGDEQLTAQKDLFVSLIGKEVTVHMNIVKTAETYGTIHISQTEHQTITVVANGTSYTSDIQLPYGTKYIVSIQADKGYIAGTLSEVNGILYTDTVITATAATAKQYTVTIVQTEHQTITVTAGGKKYTKTTQLPYDMKYTVSIQAEKGYTAGTLSFSSGIITGDIEILATGATLNSYTVTIKQSENQTIFVDTYDADNTKTRHQETFTVDAGTKYEILFVADLWYKSGTLTLSPTIEESGNLYQDVAISATEASIQTDYTLTATMSPSNKYPDKQFGMQCTYIWEGTATEDNKYGDIDPKYVIDILYIAKWANNSFTSDIAFWGRNPVTGLFKTCDVTLIEENGTEHKLLDKEPNSSFGTTIQAGMGDIINAASWTNEANWNLFKSLVGKSVTIKLHIDL